MKAKPEYIEGPEAAVNFERMMRGLFAAPQIPRPVAKKKHPKRKQKSPT
jgi:hypothetical protein